MQTYIRLAGKKLYADFFQVSPFLRVLRWLMLVLSLLNAVGLIMVLSMVREQAVIGPEFYLGLNLGVFLLILMKDFVPSYQKVVLYDVAYFPLRAIHKALIWMIGNELSFFNLIIVVNLLVVLFSPFFQLIHLAGALLGLFIAIEASFLLRFQLDYTYPKKIISIGTALLGAVLFGAVQVMAFRTGTIGGNYLLGLSGVALVLALPMAWIFRMNAKFYRLKVQKVYRLEISKRGLQMPAKLVNSMLFGLGFKAFFLLFNFIELNQDQQYLFNSEFLFLLLLPPTVLFTYGLNNYHAFNPNYFYNILLRTGSAGPFFRRFAKEGLLFLLLDLSLTLGLLLFYWESVNAMELIAFYFTCALFLFPTGLFGSLYFPVKIEKKSFLSNMKMYAHPVVSILSIAGVYLLYHFRYYIFFQIGLLLILGTILLVLLYQKFDAIKHRFITTTK